MDRTIGTCSNCGGRVTLSENWMRVIPPVPTCFSCGATQKQPYGPVIEMERPDPNKVARSRAVIVPKPVKLPDTLIAGTGSLNPVDRIWHSTAEMVAGFQAAAARYNAYPGLRAAAERLHAVLRTMAVAGEVGELHIAWNALKAELAKGPR